MNGRKRGRFDDCQNKQIRTKRQSGNVIASMTSTFSSEINAKHCSCCFGCENLKNTLLTDCHDGERETYANMIAQCFNLKLELRFDNLRKYRICDSCIERVREAFLFKKLMETTREKFISGDFRIAYKKRTEPENDDFFDSDIRTSFFDPLWDHDYTVTCNFRNDPNRDSPAMEGDESTVLFLDSINEMYDDENFDGIVEEIQDDDAEIEPKRVSKEYLNPGIEFQIIPNERETSNDNASPLLKSLGDLSCTICDNGFFSKCGLKRHMATHFPNFVCDICNEAFAEEEFLKYHLKQHAFAGTHTREVCSKSFDSSATLKNHQRQHGFVQKCPRCPDEFDSDSDRQKHLSEVHGESPTSRNYKCRLCSKVYATYSSRLYHERVFHLQEKRFSCEICSHKCWSKTNLRVHMQKHSDVRSFHCEPCDKSFKKLDHLKRHFANHKRILARAKRRSCNVCGEKFSNRQSLRVHMKAHKIRNIVCTMCNKTFKNKGNLTSHMKVHNCIISLI